LIGLFVCFVSAGWPDGARLPGSLVPSSASSPAPAPAASSAESSSAESSSASTTPTTAESATSAAASSATATSATATSSSPSAAASSAGRAGVREPRYGQELVGSDVHEIVRLEALGQDPRIHLDAYEQLGGLAEDLVDLADLPLVLQVNSRVEVRDLLVQRPQADELRFAVVQHLAGFDDFRGRSLLATESSSPSSSTSSAAEPSAPSAAAPAKSSSSSTKSAHNLRRWCGAYRSLFRSRFVVEAILLVYFCRSNRTRFRIINIQL